VLKPIHPFEPAAPETSRARADALIAWLRDYAERRIDTHLMDERRCVSPHIVLDFGNRGLFGLQIPDRFGGLALNHCDMLRVLEQLAAIDIGLASLVFIHNANGIRPILGWGRPALREALLPVLAQGRELSAFALTEPAAGSNLPGLETRAVPDGEGAWRLYGVKRWNASGWAGIVTVFARVVDARGRLGHPAGFVVRQGMEGVRVGPESLTMGVRNIMQNSLILDGVRVTEAELLGEPARGMEVADEALLIARLCMGAISLGAMKRCAQIMLRYADRRQVSTGRLVDSPMTLAVFSELTARIAAVQALVDRLAGILDAGEYPAEEACMVAKIVASDALWEAADACVEMLGGRGYMENNPAARILRDCRMLRIGEGANELMTLSVGRRVGHSESLRRLMRETLGCAGLDERLREAGEQIMARCLAPEAAFADRGSAVAFAHTLTGQVAIRAVLLAVLEAAARADGAPVVHRARDLAAAAFETTLARALAGSAEEGLQIDPATAAALVGAYAGDIGDIEEAPPGVELGPDPMLRREPGRGGFAPFAHLPGNADPAAKPAAPAPKPSIESLSPEDRRRLAAALVRRQRAAAS
jgi:alkylation response protein AidB-like acyl-CoA dehydrogenase